MIWHWMAIVAGFVLDLFTVRFSTPDKDLEILLLRQQLRVLERKLGHTAGQPFGKVPTGRAAHPTPASDTGVEGPARVAADL
jgi:hypothetical protein